MKKKLELCFEDFENKIKKELDLKVENLFTGGKIFYNKKDRNNFILKQPFGDIYIVFSDENKVSWPSYLLKFGKEDFHLPEKKPESEFGKKVYNIVKNVLTDYGIKVR